MQTQPQRTRGRTRSVLTLGIVLCAGALVTSAASTQTESVLAYFDASPNQSYNLQVDGSAAADWTLADAVWQEASTEPYTIPATADGSAVSMPPGKTQTYRLAVHNDSPELLSSVSLRIEDADPQGSATDPHTGRYLDLFPHLHFTLADEQGTLLDAAGTDVLRADLRTPLAAGESRLLTLDLTVPSNVGNEIIGAGTQVSVLVTGESQ